MIVYKTTDRIPVKIGEVTLWIAPLSTGQYTEVIGLTKMKGGKEVTNPGGMAMLTLRYVVKSVDGLDAQFLDGSEFELEFDGDQLSEESLNTLIQVLGSDKLSLLASKLVINGIKDHKIPGVEIDLKNAVSVKKKKTS